MMMLKMSSLIFNKLDLAHFAAIDMKASRATDGRRSHSLRISNTYVFMFFAKCCTELGTAGVRRVWCTARVWHVFRLAACALSSRGVECFPRDVFCRIAASQPCAGPRAAGAAPPTPHRRPSRRPSVRPAPSPRRPVVGVGSGPLRPRTARAATGRRSRWTVRKVARARRSESSTSQLQRTARIRGCLGCPKRPAYPGRRVRSAAGATGRPATGGRVTI